MAETLLTQYLKRGQPDPLADIGQGGPGLYQSPNRIPDEISAIGQHFVPEYLKGNTVHALAPNAAGKTPSTQNLNPLPWLGADIAGNLATGGAKAAAPALKAMFLGPMAKIANLGKLAKAKEMTAQGAHDILREFKGARNAEAEALIPSAMSARDRAVFKETNWFRRPDAKWRTPISDETAHGSNIGFEAGRDPNGVPLPRALWHSNLYKAYPEFKDIQFYTLPDSSKSLGAYHPDGLMGAKFRPNPDRTSTLLHEGQHAIQGVEDFAPGANPDNLATYGEELLKARGIQPPLPKEDQKLLNQAAFNLYQRHSGEDESRMVQRLHAMTPEMQRTAVPYNSLIGRSQQVVPGAWLERQTPEIQDYVKNTMTHQFQGGPPILENYINLLKLDAR